MSRILHIDRTTILWISC